MPPGYSLLYFLAGLTLRPYIPPTLPPDPEVVSPSHALVEVSPRENAWDASVFARPSHTAPLAGHVAKGTRLSVRGELQVPGRGCDSGVYLALSPFGWICSADTRPSTGAPTSAPVLSLVEGTPVPYRYAMVNVEEGSFIPMWASVSDLWSHLEPERELGRGDTIAIESTLEDFEGARYYLTVDGKVVPAAGLNAMKAYSGWQGVPVDGSTHFPFGWITPQKAPVYDAPGSKIKVDELARRTRIDVLEEVGEGKQRYLRIGDARYVRADHVNEVRVTPRPENTGRHAQWIDVDLGEQVVIAYQNDKPAFATMTSSGREPNHTPRGNYPVWGKASAITMKSQDYDDAPYYVNRVPWVMFFQAHNALHGAYWHDRFGVVKSHGCANLSPLDARTLFDWLEPKLPPGWTSVRYVDLNDAPVVHVHDSGKTKKPFYQERNIGPPDKNDEAERLQKALERREAKAMQEAAGLAADAGTPFPPAQPSIVPALPP